jgi:hypothetical protein
MSPEFLLTAACCRWPPSNEHAAAIRAAVKNVADWDHFLRLVKRHRVAMLVVEALRKSAIELPPGVSDELHRVAKRNVRGGLKLAVESYRLQSLLMAAGIPNVVLKGVAIERLAYGSISAKQTRDIDLLVPPECAEAAIRIVEADGYTLSLPAHSLSDAQRRALIRFGREVELVQPRKKIRTELQWRVADNSALLSGIDAHAATQTITLSQGASVRTLASDDLFAYLCVHGARHSWSRLKWLADLNAFIASSPTGIVNLYRHSQKVGAGYCAGQALLLCERLFGAVLPVAFAREIQADKRCRKLVEIAMAAMTARHAPGDADLGMRGVVRELRNQFLLGDGFAFYAAQCRLVCAGVADIVRLPLPRPLHFIYPFVRLPMWLWRRAKFAVATL